MPVRFLAVKVTPCADLSVLFKQWCLSNDVVGERQPETGSNKQREVAGDNFCD